MHSLPPNFHVDITQTTRCHRVSSGRAAVKARDHVSSVAKRVIGVLLVLKLVTTQLNHIVQRVVQEADKELVEEVRDEGSGDRTYMKGICLLANQNKFVTQSPSSWMNYA